MTFLRDGWPKDSDTQGRGAIYRCSQTSGRFSPVSANSARFWQPDVLERPDGGCAPSEPCAEPSACPTAWPRALVPDGAAPRPRRRVRGRGRRHCRPLRMPAASRHRARPRSDLGLPGTGMQVAPVACARADNSRSGNQHSAELATEARPSVGQRVNLQSWRRATLLASPSATCPKK